MASKVVKELTGQTLVDSQLESARIELETNCRSLIFTFINMKEDPSCSQNSVENLLRPRKTANTLKEAVMRGTDSGASKDKSESNEGSSVDITVSAMGSSVDLQEMDDSVHITDEDIVKDVVPVCLPSDLRDDLAKVDEDDLKKLYDIKAGMEKIASGELSTVELIVLHARSYRNILQYDIPDVETFRKRFVTYFGSIFADLIQTCYPNRTTQSVVRKKILKSKY